MHEQHMRAALEQAYLALASGEIPVGAVVTCGGQIVAAAHNERETTGDPTAHAEVLALRRAAQALGRRRLEGCTLYVTLEPCPMCAGLLAQAGLDEIVFGARDALAGCCGSWGFALLARFTYPGVLPVLADSGRMTLANLLPTVGNLAFLAWFPLLAKAAPAWFVYLLPLWLLIGGAGSALGMASLMRPAFAQLEKAGRKEEEPEEEPDTEDSVQ